MVKEYAKKIAKFILAQPDQKINVQVTPILSGGCLSDQKILITGGSRGLGCAMAKRFIEEGAAVVITGRKEENLKQAALEIGCNYLVHDVGDIMSIKPMLEHAKEMLGGDITSVVSNAGVSLHENGITAVSEEQFDLQFDTNLKGPFFLAQAYIEMIDRKEYKNRNLLFITSETADQGYDRPYGLTKAALNRLVQGLSHRTYKSGLRVNAIAPGVTLTDMTSSYTIFSGNDIACQNVPGRYYLPEEIAEVACFLLSNASLCISGEIIHCNGCNHVKTYWD